MFEVINLHVVIRVWRSIFLFRFSGMVLVLRLVEIFGSLISPLF